MPAARWDKHQQRRNQTLLRYPAVIPIDGADQEEQEEDAEVRLASAALAPRLNPLKREFQGASTDSNGALIKVFLSQVGWQVSLLMKSGARKTRGDTGSNNRPPEWAQTCK